MAYGRGVGEPPFVPGPEIGRAVAFAALHHGGQLRKGTTIPYLQHLLGVASIALELGSTEVETVAALLHDVLEDTAVAEDELRAAFGTEVAEIVVWCSAEAKTGGSAVDSWRARKQAYLDHLSRAPAAAVLVSLADKIHNARSIGDDLRRSRDPVSYWKRFNADRSDQLWYLRSLIEIYEARSSEPGARITLGMVDELRRAVDTISYRAG